MYMYALASYPSLVRMPRLFSLPHPEEPGHEATLQPGSRRGAGRGGMRLMYMYA